MRVLVIGAGGVGAAAVSVAARRDFFEWIVLADVDAKRARAAVDRTGDPRFAAAAVDASDPVAIAELAHAENVDAILNAVDPPRSTRSTRSACATARISSSTATTSRPRSRSGRRSRSASTRR